MRTYDSSSTLDSLVREISRQKEQIILDQLGDLVTRGLLVVEEGPYQLLREESVSGTKLRYCQQIRLVLKDREYIENIERENKDLRARLDAIGCAIQVVKS